jgi:hypothetical protein
VIFVEFAFAPAWCIRFTRLLLLLLFVVCSPTA